MAQDNTVWPTELIEGDDLYAVVDNADGFVRYLIFSSAEMKMTLVRDNGTWAQLNGLFWEEHDDAGDLLWNERVGVHYIKYFDDLEKAGKKVPLEMPVIRLTKVEADDSAQDIVVSDD